MNHPHTGYDHVLLATSDTHRVYERRFWWNNERNTETQPLYLVTNHRNQATHKVWGNLPRAMELAKITSPA